jgi:hypothetical protein
MIFNHPPRCPPSEAECSSEGTEDGVKFLFAEEETPYDVGLEKNCAAEKNRSRASDRTTRSGVQDSTIYEIGLSIHKAGPCALFRRYGLRYSADRLRRSEVIPVPPHGVVQERPEAAEDLRLLIS